MIKISKKEYQSIWHAMQALGKTSAWCKANEDKKDVKKVKPTLENKAITDYDDES